MKIECVVEIANLVGESPMWSTAERALWWVDVRGKSLHRLRADGGRDDWPLPDFASCLALCRSGRLIVSQGGALAFFNPRDGALEEFARPEPDRPANRFNDGKCDRKGRFWIGTMVNNFGPDGADLPIDRPDGAFYRLDPDLKMTRVADGMWIPNTVAWSPDDRVFYLGDSGANEIHARDFDLESGAISNPRLFAKTGTPGIWTAPPWTPRDSCGTRAGAPEKLSASIRRGASTGKSPSPFRRRPAAFSAARSWTRSM